ncbi:MAG TPA: VOC family protein [Thermoanaerobaculia bacterium]|jgi:hypothetical protein|nr:VOC family protein [Thermoanaerobaculia bacterium]
MSTPRIDHLVYATPDLALGVSEIEALTGVRASAGGQHLGWGTHNCLAALGSDVYLEIIGPDPAQPTPPRTRPFGIDGLLRSRLVTWSARSDRLERAVHTAAQHGLLLGEILSGSRFRSDGVLLAWRLTSPRSLPEEGLVPFLIDWGSSPHPATSAATGLSLVALRAEHSSPQSLICSLDILGVSLPVIQASHNALVATIDSPMGRVELR